MEEGKRTMNAVNCNAVPNRSYQIAVQFDDLLQQSFRIETALRRLLDFQ